MRPSRLSFVWVQYARARHRFCRPCRLAWLFTGVVAMGAEEKEEAEAGRGRGVWHVMWEVEGHDKKDDADGIIRAGGAIDRLAAQAAIP